MRKHRGLVSTSSAEKTVSASLKPSSGAAIVGSFSSLGCAGLMVLDDSTDMVEAALNLARFYAHESCGQCTPCREGGHWLEKIFRRIAAGKGMAGDLSLIESICSQIGGHTICAFGDTMVLPLVSIVKKFPEEFREKIAAAMRTEWGVGRENGSGGEAQKTA